MVTQLASGSLDGYAIGSLDGYAIRSLDGYAIGSLDGYAIGSLDGYATGSLDGYAIGSLDGYAIGSLDGYAIRSYANWVFRWYLVINIRYKVQNVILNMHIIELISKPQVITNMRREQKKKTFLGIKLRAAGIDIHKVVRPSHCGKQMWLVTFSLFGPSISSIKSRRCRRYS